MDNSLIPITSDKFNNSVKIRFNNILSGFDNFLNFTITEESSSLSEEKFIKFIEYIFKENSNECYVDLYLNKLSSEDKTKLISYLSEKDKKILNFAINLNHNEPYYKVNDISLIPFLVRLNTNELFFVTFYFTKIPITIWGNYNFSFPCFFNNKDDYNHYLNLANNLMINTL